MLAWGWVLVFNRKSTPSLFSNQGAMNYMGSGIKTVKAKTAITDERCGWFGQLVCVLP